MSSFVLSDVSVIYSYTLTEASEAVVVIDSVIFQLVNVNINHSSLGNGNIARRKVRKADYVDGCAVTTSYTAMRLVGAIGTFNKVVFSNVDTGALFIDGGNIIFDNVEFKNNVIPGFSGFSRLRHNAFISKTNLTIKEVKSDVDSNIFVVSAPEDTSTIIVVTRDVSLLYTPKANQFSFENDVRGKFTGEFLPCTFSVNITHSSTHIGVVPLIVENQTTAYFDLPDGIGRTIGNYTFQFMYDVGNYTFQTADFLTVVAMDKEKGDDKSKGWVVAVVLVPIVVVVGVVTVVVGIILFKRRLKNNSTGSEVKSEPQSHNEVSQNSVEKAKNDASSNYPSSNVPASDLGKEQPKSFVCDETDGEKGTDVELEVFEIEEDMV